MENQITKLRGKTFFTFLSSEFRRQGYRVYPWFTFVSPVLPDITNPVSPHHQQSHKTSLRIDHRDFPGSHLRLTPQQCI